MARQRIAIGARRGRRKKKPPLLFSIGVSTFISIYLASMIATRLLTDFRWIVAGKTSFCNNSRQDALFGLTYRLSCLFFLQARHLFLQRRNSGCLRRQLNLLRFEAFGYHDTSVPCAWCFGLGNIAKLAACFRSVVLQ